MCQKSCPVTKTKFLSNNKNKESFISFLAAKMNSDGIETFIADNDCDTEIVRRAIEYSKTVAVDIIANDTDY